MHLTGTPAFINAIEEPQVDAIEVEPFDSEPYEAGYDGYHETIQYESSVIDEIEVDYNFTTVGEQKIEIER